MTVDSANTRAAAHHLLEVFTASPHRYPGLSERMRPIQEMGLGLAYDFAGPPAGEDGQVRIAATAFPDRRRG